MAKKTNQTASNASKTPAASAPANRPTKQQQEISRLRQRVAAARRVIEHAQECLKRLGIVE
jgi:hypothetical protein